MDNFKPNENFKYYLYFIEERMNIFWLRYYFEKQPYSSDPIFQEYKFTNVYRVLDRSSQYLLKNVIYNGKNHDIESVFWRILLYKHFNLPSTWEYLEKQLGDIKIETPLKDISEVLTDLINKGETIYSNAYMLTASFMKNEIIKKKYGISTGSKKHEAYLQIFEKAILNDDLLYKIYKAGSLKEAYDIISSVITVGPFLAYQYIQDWNYTSFVDWDENSFCAAGPGTQRGIERTFDVIGKPDYEKIVKWVHNNFQQLCEDYKCEFISLPNHMPTVSDLSNCFCETFKLLKTLVPGEKSGEKRMKNKFSENQYKINFVFPPKWGEIKI